MTNEDLDSSNDLPDPLPESQEASAQPKKKVVRKKTARKNLAKAELEESESDATMTFDGRIEFSPEEDSEPNSSNAANGESATGGAQANEVSSQGESNLGREKRSHRNQEKGGKSHRFNKQRPQNPNNKRGGKKSNLRRPQKKHRSQAHEYDLIEFEAYAEHEILQSVASLESYYASLNLSDAIFDYDRIYAMDLNELREALADESIPMEGHANRQSMIRALFNRAFEAKQSIVTTGVLDIPEEGMGGFLVYEVDSYRIKILNAYVPQAFIDHYGLQKGHCIKAELHASLENTNCAFAVKILTVMDQSPEKVAEWAAFTDRIPYYPLDRIILESDIVPDKENLPMRVVDCLTPIGFGQRGLIVAPPRTGKTVLMQGIANSIQINYPDAHLIVLLIDERPEEVTDFKRKVQGEVISSTFDESADSHVHAAEVVIEKARRMVEVGKDVIILLDSITRLARAYNTSMPSSGKILSGGVEANALQLPKRFFGSARNIEDGGSLTIIATALVETGSKMDEVIFEEFKGTGNMELHLDRALSDKRIFPAISMDKSGTRKEELLYHPDEIQKIYSLRRAMKGIPSVDAMEMLIQRIKKTSTNVEFLMSVAG